MRREDRAGKKLRSMTSVYFVGEEAILCLYRIGSRIADGMYVGAAGGHFEEGELDDPHGCVLREMKEELGLEPEDVVDLRLRYITHRLKNGEIRQNYYFFGRLRSSCPKDSTEGILEWIPREGFEKLPMPVSAKHMILHYLSTGQYDDDIYAGITRESGTDFVAMEEF